MSWQSVLACWVLRRWTRPETAKPGIDVARARAMASKRVWSPKVPAGWHLVEQYGPLDAPLRGEWLTPEQPSCITILYLHGGGYYFCSPGARAREPFTSTTGSHPSIRFRRRWTMRWRRTEHFSLMACYPSAW